MSPPIPMTPKPCTRTSVAATDRVLYTFNTIILDDLRDKLKLLGGTTACSNAPLTPTYPWLYWLKGARLSSLEKVSGSSDTMLHRAGARASFYVSVSRDLRTIWEEWWSVKINIARSPTMYSRLGKIKDARIHVWLGCSS